ncbi:MAG TPA: sigma-70 family RNA polymerase sigma factor [Anaerolineales bacterium]
MPYEERKKSGPGGPPEATLFEQAQAGNQESVNLLLMRHERLVHYVIRDQQLWGLPYEEAAQAGRQGLWRAILRYDPQRGTPFASYAYRAIMHHVWAAVQANLAAMRREVSIGELRLYAYREGHDPAEVSRWEEVRLSLRALVGRLSSRLRFVIVARYGLDGQEEQTLQALGEQMGCTGEWVRRLQCEALVWLRQPAHSQELRELLSCHTQVQYELAEALAKVWLRRRGGRRRV